MEKLKKACPSKYTFYGKKKNCQSKIHILRQEEKNCPSKIHILWQEKTKLSHQNTHFMARKKREHFATRIKKLTNNRVENIL